MIHDLGAPRGTRTAPARVQKRKSVMAKKKSDGGVYRVTEIIGTSPNSWEEAARKAVETAANSLHDLRIAEVQKLDLKVDDNGKVVAYRARVSLSFKYAP
jgi:flavin-binding protein dodecin